MTKLAFGEALYDGNHQRLDMLTITTEGETAGSFYGYVTDGIFQNQTEINTHSNENGVLLQPDAEPGDFRFKDINGDGILSSDDRTIIGNPEADFSFGISLGASYKGFDFSALFTGTYGNDMLNAISPYISTGEGYYNSYAGLIDDAWSGEGTTNSQPIIKSEDNNNNFRYSDYYIEDGSHIKLKNIQLGYTLPQNISSKIKVGNVRIYIGAENLFVLTKFSGLDPDIGGSATSRGIDWGHYPLPRQINFGIKVTI
jgi:hypothetical protein